MLEELDRMHEECATLHEDAKVSFTAAGQFRCHNLPMELPTDNPYKMHLSQHDLGSHFHMDMHVNMTASLPVT